MEASEISRVGIIGAGTMGTTTAIRCIACCKEVYLFDVSAQAMEKAVQRIEAWFAEGSSDDQKVEEAQRVLSRLHLCANLRECVASVALVIEMAPERLYLKRQVFADMDRHAPPHVLLATSSSSIPCSRLAGATGRPDKVLNMHFWNDLRDGVPIELMGSLLTTSETMAFAERFVRSLGLVPIVVKREIMGFGVNTIWHEVKKAALHIADGGYVDFEDIDRAWSFLLVEPGGIFGAMDQIGLDVVRDIEMLYYEASGDERDKPPSLLDRLIAQGRLGVKSGRGFYTYPNPEYERPGWLRKEPPWTPDMTIRLEDLA